MKEPWEALIAEEEAAAKQRPWPRVTDVYPVRNMPVVNVDPDHDPARRPKLFREVSRQLREQGAIDLPDEVGFGPYEPEK